MSLMSSVKDPASRARSLDLPDFVLSRDGALKGEVIGTRPCQLAGCTGFAYIVRWPGGKRTYPCGKGCEPTDDPKTLQIG